MPYIEQDRRPFVEPTPEQHAETPGELSYQISCLLNWYVKEHGYNYDTLNAISGACTEALAEFRSEVIEPYEDDKKSENREVYETYFYTKEGRRKNK